VTDPCGAATQSLRAKNCLPMAVEHKSEISLRLSLALQTSLLHQIGLQRFLDKRKQL